jgi:hypothetical protein
LFSLSRTVVTVNATSLPSGDTAGALTVVTLYQSAGVNARLATTLAGVVVPAARVCAARGSASAEAASDAIAIGRERKDVFTGCSTLE